MSLSLGDKMEVTNFDYSGAWENYPGSEGIPIEKIRGRR